MSGTIQISRDLWDDDAFADDPFSEREAWVWMIAEASWKDREKRGVRLSRGEFAHSVRFLAEAWGWSKSRVHRFLKRLESRDSIALFSGTRGLHITICNYDKYQYSPQNRGTAAGQQRDSSGTNEKKGEIRERKNPPLPPEGFGEFWAVYPRRIAKAAAVKAYAKATSRAGPSEILAGVKRYAKATEGKEAQYIAHPATWLNGDRWADEPEAKGRIVSIEDHAAAWGMRNANHDGDSGRTADNGRQEPSRRPADDLPGMQSQPKASEPEAALFVGDVQAGWDRGALPSLRLVGGEAF